MGHHRNLCIGEPFDQVHAARATLDFHCFGASFLQEARGIRDPFSRVHLVGAVGHVGNHHRPLDRPADGAGVMDHLVHGDGEGVVIAQHHHGQRVPDQDHIDAGFVHQPCGGIVVRRQGDDGSPLGLFILKGLDGYPAGPDCGRGLVRAAELREAHGNSSAAPISGCCPSHSIRRRMPSRQS